MNGEPFPYKGYDFSPVQGDLEKMVLEIPRRESAVEIGSLAGDSCIVLARHFSKVYSIDPYLGAYDDVAKDRAASQAYLDVAKELFSIRMKDFPNVKQFQIPSPGAALGFMNSSIDCVFIDGAHLYQSVAQDIAGWLPKIRKGGGICGHDYTQKFPGVIQAVNELTHRDGLGELQLFSGGYWLYRLLD